MSGEKLPLLVIDISEFKLELYHAIYNSKKQTKITDFFKN
jgi:hypothetical protein